MSMKPLDYGAEDYLGSQIQTAETWKGKGSISVDVDAVIVGAGPGGLTTAFVLAAAGLDVVVLEGGGFWPRGSFERNQSWALKNLYQDQGTRVMQGNTFIPVASGRGVGGGTLVNSGISFRAPDRILDMWTEEYGLEHWSDRDQLFSQVEKMIGVEATRAEIAGANSRVARRGFETLGSDHHFMPRNTPGCVGCGTCQTGCPSGGKASADLNWLPRALKNGAKVYANTRVEEIVTKNGRAVGVKGVMRTHTGRELVANVEVNADRIILAAGAINTALLLIENDLANSSGQVGRNLHVHPGCGAIAKMNEEVRVWFGATQGYFSYHPTERDILAETFSAPPEAFFTHAGRVGATSADFLRELKNLASLGFLVRDESGGVVRPVKDGPPDIRYDVNEADRKKFVQGLEFVTEALFAAGSREVRPLLAHADFFTSFNEARQTIRGASVADLMLYSSHPMGTCRMGSDPANSVVRPDGRTHDVEGLYITDSSVHPTALGVNPQMTIMANSLAIAPKIATS